MKSHVLAVALLMSSTSSLMSMLELPNMKECKKLKFLLDNNNCIKSYNISIYTDKAPVLNIQGHRLLAMRPFTNSALASYLQHNSVNNSETLLLELENKQFLVKIVPVKTGLLMPCALIIKMKAVENF